MGGKEVEVDIAYDCLGLSEAPGLLPAPLPRSPLARFELVAVLAVAGVLVD